MGTPQSNAGGGKLLAVPWIQRTASPPARTLVRSSEATAGSIPTLPHRSADDAEQESISPLAPDIDVVAKNSFLPHTVLCQDRD